MQEYPTLAAIDLGSNSFHLQVARVDGEQLFYLDAHKESVRLAGGLTADKMLDEASQKRGLACLSRFGERLQGMPPGAVRAVGTSTLRVAKNAQTFLEKARHELGFGIEIVAGREEARLIYLGVAHSLPLSLDPRLVVDIGGGSTECIIGRGYQPDDRESLRMGCVVFSQRFFPEGRIDKGAMKQAMTAARMEILPVAHAFRRGVWREAVGSSGSARAMGEILEQNGRAVGKTEGGITADGLKWLRDRLLRAGHIDHLELDGLKEDRKPVIAGGVAIMSALFEELGITEMAVAQGAMREGILWDQLGRAHDQDMRAVTVGQFMRRHHVDARQARRVERLAMKLFQPLAGRFGAELVASHADEPANWLSWAARLHEIGIGIAHSGFHKHGAYILENADMPGFSRRDQIHLARLVRASRGTLSKLDYPASDALWPLILCLRLAVLFNASRADVALPPLAFECAGDGGCRLRLPKVWRAANPLTEAALANELLAWEAIRPVVRLAAIKYE